MIAPSNPADSTLIAALKSMNRNEVGANSIVATGPSFVTQENAASIAALADQGTR